MASLNNSRSQVKSNLIDDGQQEGLNRPNRSQTNSRDVAKFNATEFDDVPHKLPQPSGIYEAKLAENILRLEQQGELDPMLKERWDALYASFCTKLSSYAKDKIFPTNANPLIEGALMGSSQYCSGKEEALAIDTLAEKNRNLTSRTLILSSKIETLLSDEISSSHNGPNSEMDDDELVRIEKEVQTIRKEILENEIAIAKLEKSQRERRKLHLSANVNNQPGSDRITPHDYGQPHNLELEGDKIQREGNLHGMITYARMFITGMKAELSEAKKKCNMPPHSTDELKTCMSIAEKLELYTTLEDWFDEQIQALEQCDEIREIGSQCRMENLRARFNYPQPTSPFKTEE